MGLIRTLALVAGVIAGAESAPAAPDGGLFGSQERKRVVDGSHPFRAWARVIDRHFADLKEGKVCPKADIPECRVIAWLETLKPMRGKRLIEKLNYVNAALNETPYLTDLRNWGQQDYWETPLEFLTHYGDCEDYSIAKYMALRALDVPIDTMRIAVVNDENLGIGHAVLVVYTQNKRLVLDNQTDQVVETDRVRHYTPIYSLNERAWWLHRK